MNVPWKALCIALKCIHFFEIPSRSQMGTSLVRSTRYLIPLCCATKIKKPQSATNFEARYAGNPPAKRKHYESPQWMENVRRLFSPKHHQRDSCKPSRQVGNHTAKCWCHWCATFIFLCKTTYILQLFSRIRSKLRIWAVEGFLVKDPKNDLNSQLMSHLKPQDANANSTWPLIQDTIFISHWLFYAHGVAN